MAFGHRPIGCEKPLARSPGECRAGRCNPPLAPMWARVDEGLICMVGVVRSYAGRFPTFYNYSRPHDAEAIGCGPPHDDSFSGNIAEMRAAAAWLPWRFPDCEVKGGVVFQNRRGALLQIAWRRGFGFQMEFKREYENLKLSCSSMDVAHAEGPPPPEPMAASGLPHPAVAPKEDLGPAPFPLSVVVVTVESAGRLRACLDAIQRQKAPVEILVPWDGSHGACAALRQQFPNVRFTVAGRQKLTFAQLRAHGISQATGDIVAITEDHFTPAPDWCRQILEAHREPHAAIGGAVEKQTPDTVLNWAFYLADYLRYLDPPEGPSAHLTDGNVTYKRAALMEIRNVWEVEFHENLIHAALRARGQSLWLSPRIVVRQRRQMTLRNAIRDRYAFGRLFGSTRVEGMSLAGRLKFMVLCLVLPALLLLRVASHLLRTRRYVAASLRALPALVLISIVWAWGEFVGYITMRPDRSLSARFS